MELSEATSKLIELYGLPGIVIAVLLFVCRALWIENKDAAKRAEDNGIKMALAMERNTQAMEALRETIRDRK